MMVEEMAAAGTVEVVASESIPCPCAASADSGTGRGASVKLVRDTGIKYLGHHFGASWVEHVRFAAAIREGRPAEIGLEEGLRAVATGLAAHKSIDEGRVVEMSEILSDGW